MVCAALVAVGCAPRVGWQRTETRACAPHTQAVVCLQAEPDRAVTFGVGGATVVPGECVLAPHSRASGSLRVTVDDGRGEPVVHRVRIARWARTVVLLDADGALSVVSREACDASVPQ
ncbi:MAG: hypothetical protein JKY37_20805 [Nannocystaceae bacterium]|nr:hypothetical protein [Nannocystaceae bacterium]